MRYTKSMKEQNQKKIKALSKVMGSSKMNPKLCDKKKYYLYLIKEIQNQSINNTFVNSVQTRLIQTSLLSTKQKSAIDKILKSRKINHVSFELWLTLQ